MPLLCIKDATLVIYYNLLKINCNVFAVDFFYAPAADVLHAKAGISFLRHLKLYL